MKELLSNWIQRVIDMWIHLRKMIMIITEIALMKISLRMKT